MTLLCRAIVTRRLSTFLRSSLRLLRSDTAQAHRQLANLDADIIIQLFQRRALAELELLPLPIHALDGRALAVELLLDLLSIDAQGPRQRAIELICRWCDDADRWKECMEVAVRLLVSRPYIPTSCGLMPRTGREGRMVQSNPSTPWCYE